jgi:hypothetical protein
VIEKVEAYRLPPAAALLEEIEKRRRTPAVTMSGLGPVLAMLSAYIIQTDARIALLESAVPAHVMVNRAAR